MTFVAFAFLRLSWLRPRWFCYARGVLGLAVISVALVRSLVLPPLLHLWCLRSCRFLFVCGIFGFAVFLLCPRCVRISRFCCVWGVFRFVSRAAVTARVVVSGNAFLVMPSILSYGCFATSVRLVSGDWTGCTSVVV